MLLLLLLLLLLFCLLLFLSQTLATSLVLDCNALLLFSKVFLRSVNSNSKADLYILIVLWAKLRTKCCCCCCFEFVCFCLLVFLSSLYHLQQIFIFYFSECCTSVRHTNVTALNTISTSYPAVTSLRKCQPLCDTEKLSGEDCVVATWQTDTAVCDVSTLRCFTGESEN